MKENKMRTVIFLCMIILGHCINPQIITTHSDNIDEILRAYIAMTFLISVGLDYIDLIREKKQTNKKDTNK